MKADPVNQFFAGNPFLSIYSVGYFVQDEHLGHRFFRYALVGSNQFCDLQSMVSQIVRERRPVIVCLGDSSMSGWNSDSVSLHGVCSEQVFFTYPTFPDFLRKTYRCHVINGGVPGFSSLQGFRYGAQLLNHLSDAAVRVDAVVIFFGNNDATFSTVTDVERLQAGEGAGQEKVRVSVPEFRSNLEGLLGMCEAHRTSPVVVVPPRNLHWLPGLRSKRFPQEMEAAFSKLHDRDARQSLVEARECFGRREFDKAAELDIVLPRVKERYVEVLTEIAETNGIQLIDIPIAELTAASFLDYCHPSPILNQHLAAKIGSACGLERSSPRGEIREPRCRILNSLMSVRLHYISMRLAMGRKSSGVRADGREPNVYPFY